MKRNLSLVFCFAMTMFVSIPAPAQKQLPELTVLDVCGVRAYVGMPLTAFLEKLGPSNICKYPTAEELAKSFRWPLLSIDAKTNMLHLKGFVRFQSAKLTEISKLYGDSSNELEQADLIIDVLAKFEREHQEKCTLSTTTIAEPEQHTRTTKISCGARAVEITAGSATMQSSGNSSVKGGFVTIEETLGY